jgi:hypothetical protein
VGLNIARFEQRSGNYEKTVSGDGVRREGSFATANAEPAQNTKLAVIEFKDVEYVAHHRFPFLYRRERDGSLGHRVPGSEAVSPVITRNAAWNPKVPVCRTNASIFGKRSA